MYGTASNTHLQQLDSIHDTKLRLALEAFCTCPVSSLYVENNEAPLEERRLKLSMNYYLKTRACIENPAHHALHEYDQTTRDLYAPQVPTRPVGLRVEAAMASAEICVDLITFHCLSKSLPDNSTIFATITLALDYMEPVQHNVVVYSWLNVMLASDWGGQDWEPSHLLYHEPSLAIER